MESFKVASNAVIWWPVNTEVGFYQAYCYDSSKAVEFLGFLKDIGFI